MRKGSGDVVDDEAIKALEKAGFRIKAREGILSEISDNRQILDLLSKINDSIEKGFAGIVTAINVSSSVHEDMLDYIKARDEREERSVAIRRQEVDRANDDRRREMAERGESMQKMNLAAISLMRRLVESRTVDGDEDFDPNQ